MRLRRIKNLSSEFRMMEPGIRKQSAFTRLRRVNLRPKRKFLCNELKELLNELGFHEVAFNLELSSGEGTHGVQLTRNQFHEITVSHLDGGGGRAV